jgi:hypothetical protein
MNKITLLSVLFAISTIATVNAQTNAIGLRLGTGEYFGAEASFQHYLNDANRLEIGLGLNDNAFSPSVVYQWVMDLSALAEGFKWYAGVGGSAIFYSSNAIFGVVGNLGIEYNFHIPLRLSLDIRPGFYFGNDWNGFGFGAAALGVRYTF